MSWVPPGPAILFCPADRPDRFEKAASRADAIILDLEDAVAPQNRGAAREAVAASALDPARTIVRVNPVDSPDHAADLDMLRGTRYRCVMLAKTESGEQVRQLHEATGCDVLALAETALGVVRAADIAAAPGCVGMMWGSEDLLASMGGSLSRWTEQEVFGGRVAQEYRDVPRYARSQVAVAAAAFGRWMVDAVYFDIHDDVGLRRAALDAVALGFVATACIHPAQVGVVREAYAPTSEQIAWAEKVLAAAREHDGVSALEGQMIDGPVFRQAEAILNRAGSRG